MWLFFPHRYESSIDPPAKRSVETKKLFLNIVKGNKQQSDNFDVLYQELHC